MNKQPDQFKCPKCGVEIDFNFQAIIPPSQCLTLEIKSESEFISAKTIGKQILAMEDFLRSVAKETGENVHVFMKNMVCEPKIIRLEFLITTAKK